MERPGQNLTLENRGFANIEVDKNTRYKQILEVLGDDEMTAKEIANEMYRRGFTPTNERNFSSPRITEMLIKGILEIAGSKRCSWTNKSVTIYRKRNY